MKRLMWKFGFLACVGMATSSAQPPGGAPPGGGQRGPGGGPSPDRMLTHAFEFDADGDGKLNRDEMRKFIADFIRMHEAGGPGGPGRPGRAGRPPEGGERPERPRRPE